MTDMAICMGMAARVGGVTYNALKPVTCGYARRAQSHQLCLRRFAHGVRSSLYEHVREGYSDKPDLDMRLVCEETDKVIANVENRKGGLRGDDVREIVRHLHLLSIHALIPVTFTLVVVVVCCVVPPCKPSPDL